MTQRFLREAINVDGAELIGSAKGFDIFDILTYDAAQAFVNEQTGAAAGQDWTQNAGVFNSNINDSLHLYFITSQNTNRVKYGIIKGTGTDNQSLVIKNMNDGLIELEVNFSLENSNHQAMVAAEDKIPLYLLPNWQVADPIDENGVVIVGDSLEAVLPQFSVSDSVIIDNLPDQVERIKSDAFSYGHIISILVIPSRIRNLDANVITDNIHEIGISGSMEKPESWNDRWNSGAENRTTYGYGLSDEERAEVEAEIIERERQEAELRRAEEERLAREAAIKAEREARKIRYRIEGDHVVIKGTRKGISELEIPSEIEGKPVTKIEAYAFYDNPDLKKIIVPPSVKMIERAAFDRLSNLRTYVKVSPDCIVGKDNGFVRKR